MRILIYAGTCIKSNFSFIAPMRIVRVLKRYGHQVQVINFANTLIPYKTLKAGMEKFDWGTCYTLSPDDMLKQLYKSIEEWKPDLIYGMGATHLIELLDIHKKYKIPLGLHGGDPYYAHYPSKHVVKLYQKVDFITFNEGQAWNHIKSVYPEMKEKCYLLNHGIDPELSPSLEEIESLDKKYICSIIGGDDKIRRKELILYFYQWTNYFPQHSFAIGGSYYKGSEFPYTKEELASSIKNNDWNHTTFTDEEVNKYSNKKFNLIRIPNDLPYPLGVSHDIVHKLYSESYYGFTPYGYYLREGWQSEYNTMTFGTKIFEMGGSGSAMIANRIKDIEHVIKHGETGLIFDKPEDGYQAFKLAVAKPKEVKQMGINAYKFIHKYHSWNNRYEEVLLPIFKKLGIAK